MENKKVFTKKVLNLFAYGITLFGVFLIINSYIIYLETNDINSFLYHNLVSVFNGNAIYYSLLFIFSLVILLENFKAKNKVLNVVLSIFNILILILLSSKIFGLILSIILIYYLFKSKKIKLIYIGLICFLIGFTFILKGENIKERYSRINLESIFSTKKEITPSTYFDGFELRKELLKMGAELSLNNFKNFFLGIGPGDSQDELNELMKKKNFYIGKNTPKDNGYLKYNFHNQYLQTLVETGVFGLLFLVFILFYLIRLAIKTNNKYLLLFNVIFGIAFLTESILSRQIGIISFIGFNSFLIFGIKDESKKEFGLALKRIFDITFSLFVILFILSWLCPILLIIISFDTKSSPIFTQKRAGLNSNPFNCFKMRTMIVNRKSHHLPAQKNDKRVTRIGAILRKYAIDELPQFFNVFFGTMSVIGPRPLMIFEEKKMTELIPSFSSRLKVKPGITGLAQANGYKGFMEHDSDIRIRYRLDKLYLKKRNFILDIKIIFKTILYLIKQKN